MYRYARQGGKKSAHTSFLNTADVVVSYQMGELGPTSSDKEGVAGGGFLCCEKWTEMLEMIIQVYWSKARRQLEGRLMLSLTAASS